MAGRYAQNTTVSSQDSLAEIERTVTRYGASAFSYGWDQTTAIVGFKLRDRVIRFRIAMPDRDADEFLAATMLPHGGTVGEWAREQVDQAVRSGQMPSLLPGAVAALPSGRRGA